MGTWSHLKEGREATSKKIKKEKWENGWKRKVRRLK